MNQRNLQDLVSYNPATGEFKQLASMSIARFQMGVAVLNGCLYVVGGTHRQEVLSSVERYSFRKVFIYFLNYHGRWLYVNCRTSGRRWQI